MKCFSDDGSQEKLCFYRSSVKHRNTCFNGVFNFFDYFVNVHSFQEVNMHWQMAILSVPSYNLGRTFMLKKIKKNQQLLGYRRKGHFNCYLRGGTDQFFSWLPGLEEVQIIWNHFMVQTFESIHSPF